MHTYIDFEKRLKNEVLADKIYYICTYIKIYIVGIWVYLFFIWNAFCMQSTITHPFFKRFHKIYDVCKKLQPVIKKKKKSEMKSPS